MSDLRSVLSRMAVREAAAHLLVQELTETSPGILAPAAPPTAVRLVGCTTCGPASAFPARHTPQPDLECWWIAGEDTAVPRGTSVLTMLRCEWLTPRALLPVVVASARFGGMLRLAFHSRAVAWSRLAEHSDEERVRAVDESEAWVSVLDVRVPAADAVATLADTQARFGALTVPACTRAAAAPGTPAGQVREAVHALRPYPLTPHHADTATADLADFYVEVQRTALVCAFGAAPPMLV